MAAARDGAAARGACAMIAPVASGGSCRHRVTCQPSLCIRSPACTFALGRSASAATAFLCAPAVAASACGACGNGALP